MAYDCGCGAVRRQSDAAYRRDNERRREYERRLDYVNSIGQSYDSVYGRRRGK